MDHFKAFILEKCTPGAKDIAGSSVRFHLVYTMPDMNKKRLSAETSGLHCRFG